MLSPSKKSFSINAKSSPEQGSIVKFQNSKYSESKYFLKVELRDPISSFFKKNLSECNEDTYVSPVGFLMIFSSYVYTLITLAKLVY